jgi:hypothetical protein
VNPQALMRPETRNYLGALSDTVAQANWLELALGTHGRSAGQWDIWAAVYGPQGTKRNIPPPPPLFVSKILYQYENGRLPRQARDTHKRTRSFWGQMQARTAILIQFGTRTRA